MDGVLGPDALVDGGEEGCDAVFGDDRTGDGGVDRDGDDGESANFAMKSRAFCSESVVKVRGLR